MWITVHFLWVVFCSCGTMLLKHCQCSVVTAAFQSVEVHGLLRSNFVFKGNVMIEAYLTDYSEWKMMVLEGRGECREEKWRAYGTVPKALCLFLYTSLIVIVGGNLSQGNNLTTNFKTLWMIYWVEYIKMTFRKLFSLESSNLAAE